MATFPSRRPLQVVGGGPATAEQIAALTVALDVVLAEEPAPAAPDPWRWAGRGATGAGLDWRLMGLPAHRSRP